jgi:hypothetical protein
VPQPMRLMQALSDAIDGKSEILSNDWDLGSAQPSNIINPCGYKRTIQDFNKLQVFKEIHIPDFNYLQNS